MAPPLEARPLTTPRIAITVLNHLPVGILATRHHGAADETMLGDLHAIASANAPRFDVPIVLVSCFPILLMVAIAVMSLRRGYGRVSQGRSTRGRVHRKEPASSVYVLSTTDTAFANAKSRG